MIGDLWLCYSQLETISSSSSSKSERGPSQMRGSGANFLSDRLILQKVPITAKIPKNNFSSIKGGDSGIENQVNFGVSFMNKLRSAVEHSNDQAEELFEGELCDVPPCFSVNCTDQIYQGKKSSILKRLPLIMPTTLRTWSDF